MRKFNLLVAALVLSCAGRAEAGWLSGEIGSAVQNSVSNLRKSFHSDPTGSAFYDDSYSGRFDTGRLARFFERPVSALFQKIAAMKGDRVFHEKGQAYYASFSPSYGESIPAIVRLSRGLPSAPGKKEILGLAVKVKTDKGDQDFLLVSSRDDHGFLATRTPARSTHFDHQSFSSLTSFFDTGPSRGPITTRISSFAHGDSFTNPVDGSGAAHGKLHFSLARKVSFGLSGLGQRDIGSVQVDLDKPLDAQQSAGLKFNPFNDALGVKPKGLINGLRKFAYRGSQAGRGVK